MRKYFKHLEFNQNCLKDLINLKHGQVKSVSLLYKITLSVIFICSLFTLQLQAQQVRIFNTENSGLPHNKVASIEIDSQGNKWFGTFYGEVVKFDDVNWTVYDKSNSGLPGEYQISSIAIDAQDNKWFGASFAPNLNSGGGLVKFDNVNWTTYNTLNSGLPNNLITDIAIDSLGNKWIGTWGGGVAKFDDNNWNVYLGGDHVTDIAVDVLGNKWISTLEAIVKYDDSNWTNYYFSKSIIPYYNGNGGITSIGFDNKGNKWFGVGEDWDSGAAGGVTKFDDAGWTIYDSNNSELPYGVHFTVTDKMGNLWFASSYWSVGALVKYDGTNWTVYDSINSGLPNDRIESMDIDDQGNIWLTTRDSGVAVFNEKGVTTGKYENLYGRSYDFAIYPNPAKDFIQIEGVHWETLEIFNSLGIIVTNLKVQGIPAKVDISGLPGGMYTVRAMTKGNVATTKFIKEN